MRSTKGRGRLSAERALWRRPCRVPPPEGGKREDRVRHEQVRLVPDLDHERRRDRAEAADRRGRCALGRLAQPSVAEATHRAGARPSPGFLLAASGARRTRAGRLPAGCLLGESVREQPTRTWKLHKRLHTHRTFAQSKLDRHERADWRRSCRASSGLEPETPSFTMRSETVALGFHRLRIGLFERFSRGLICHRLSPVAPAGLHKCSIPSRRR